MNVCPSSLSHTRGRVASRAPALSPAPVEVSAASVASGATIPQMATGRVFESARPAAVWEIARTIRSVVAVDDIGGKPRRLSRKAHEPHAQPSVGAVLRSVADECSRAGGRAGAHPRRLALAGARSAAAFLTGRAVRDPARLGVDAAFAADDADGADLRALGDVASEGAIDRRVALHVERRQVGGRLLRGVGSGRLLRGIRGRGGRGATAQQQRHHRQGEDDEGAHQSAVAEAGLGVHAGRARVSPRPGAVTRSGRGQRGVSRIGRYNSIDGHGSCLRKCATRSSAGGRRGSPRHRDSRCLQC